MVSVLKEPGVLLQGQIHPVHAVKEERPGHSLNNVPPRAVLGEPKEEDHDIWGEGAELRPSKQVLARKWTMDKAIEGGRQDVIVLKFSVPCPFAHQFLHS